MKRKSLLFLCICMILLVSCLLSGCGATQKKAEDALTALMQDLQSGHTDSMAAYGISDTQLTDEEAKAVVTATVSEVLKKTDYRILSTKKIDSANVQFEIELTTPDYAQIVNAYLTEIMAMTSDAAYRAQLPTMTSDDYQKKLAETMKSVLSRDDFSMTQTTCTLTMVKQDGQWQPGGDKDAFFEKLFGNLAKAVSSLA